MITALFHKHTHTKLPIGSDPGKVPVRFIPRAEKENSAVHHGYPAHFVLALCPFEQYSETYLTPSGVSMWGRGDMLRGSVFYFQHT